MADAMPPPSMREALAYRKAFPHRQRLPLRGSCRANARLKEFFGSSYSINDFDLSATFGDASSKGRKPDRKMHFAWTAKGSHFGRADKPERVWLRGQAG